MATRKARSDSAAAMIKAAKNVALGDPMPPAHVQISPGVMPDYLAIVRARARDEWSELDLIVAAQLAECIGKQREQDIQLVLEGDVIKNDKGTMVANPRVSILAQLAGRQMAYMRTLQMGGRLPGTAGDKRKKQGARALEHGARASKAEAAEEENELLA